MRLGIVSGNCTTVLDSHLYRTHYYTRGCEKKTQAISNNICFGTYLFLRAY